MKALRPILLVLGVATFSTAAAADEADLKVLLGHFRQSSSEYLDSVKGLTPEQWNYQPGPDSWSVAECAEHIALSEDLLRELVEKKVLAAPPRSQPVADLKALDDKVLKMITDRSFKAKAPEPLVPSKKFATPQ